ncbi:hypothetical protein ColLi_12793 [Colletotrichum liriopes]|uniref:Uncharacterized protein n=1 Tax=Colletotrichum liriopes TaxID=708192 RepID=A0AA37H0B4_9PEZI|nr:hypothetical protein ColLi_12793 [Colletotrichum liriopes]
MCVEKSRPRGTHGESSNLFPTPVPPFHRSEPLGPSSPPFIAECDVKATNAEAFSWPPNQRHQAGQDFLFLDDSVTRNALPGAGEARALGDIIRALSPPQMRPRPYAANTKRPRFMTGTPRSRKTSSTADLQ